MAIITVEYLSQALKRNTTYKVVIPNDNLLHTSKGYENHPDKFKTLYLLNGYYGNCSDWLYYSRIEVYARENNLCVVMPSGENSFYVDALSKDNNYSEFIYELVQKTREMFPLSNLRQDTYIGGLSMGGYGAIVNGLKYCDIFSYIIGLSNAVNMFDGYTNTLYNEQATFGDIELAKNSYVNPKWAVDNAKDITKLPNIYMACGLQDGLYKCNVELKDYFVSKGLNVVWDQEDGGHEWNFWDRQILKAIKLLPLDDKKLNEVTGGTYKKDIGSDKNAKVIFD